MIDNNPFNLLKTDDGWKIIEKTKSELDEETHIHLQRKEKETNYKTLFDKYGHMIDLYSSFSYKSDDGEYDSRYFRELPMQVIEKFGETKLTSTKLRQYYNVVSNLYKIWLEWEKLMSELYLLLAKANYDSNRKENVPKKFVDFLRINIDMVFDHWFSKEKFKVFKKHFEAVVAYAKW